MSVGQWQPENQSQQININVDQLKKFVELPLENLQENISEEDLKDIQQWISLDLNFWQEPSNNLEDSELLKLIQFFTLAESFQGCQAGDKCCVIALVKLYRKRGLKIDKDFLQWIKANTDNKFLPNGPL